MSFQNFTTELVYVYLYLTIITYASARSEHKTPGFGAQQQQVGTKRKWGHLKWCCTMYIHTLYVHVVHISSNIRHYKQKVGAFQMDLLLYSVQCTYPLHTTNPVENIYYVPGMLAPPQPGPARPAKSKPCPALQKLTKPTGRNGAKLTVDYTDHAHTFVLRMEK